MGLFDIFKRPKATSAQAQPLAEKLDENGELPWGWHYRHQDEFRDFEHAIVEYATYAKDVSNKVDDRIAAYEALIALYEEKKSYYLGLDECHAKYFSDMWMHCHNSQCDDFEYVDPRKHALAELREKYDDLKKRETLLPTLDDELWRYIMSNAPVMQTDVYKAFDPVLKNDVQDRLYWWSKEGRITREKSGRSYLVSLGGAD